MNRDECDAVIRLSIHIYVHDALCTLHSLEKLDRVDPDTVTSAATQNQV